MALCLCAFRGYAGAGLFVSESFVNGHLCLLKQQNLLSLLLRSEKMKKVYL